MTVGEIPGLAMLFMCLAFIMSALANQSNRKMHNAEIKSLLVRINADEELIAAQKTQIAAYEALIASQDGLIAALKERCE